VFRNWKLFTALLIGVTLAATFFAGISIKANVAAEQTLNNQIRNVMTDMSCQASLNMSNLPLVTDYIRSMENVKNVDYLTTFWSPVSIPSDNYTSVNYLGFASFPNSSRIYDEWLNKPPGGITTNYTYILEGSNLAKKVSIGDNITTMISFQTPKYYNATTYYVNLTVAGVARLTDEGYALLSGNDWFYPDSSKYRSDFMIISWENTLEPLWESAPDTSTQEIRYAINVDREALISPWNVQASVTRINLIADTIQNKMLSYMSWAYVNNALSSSLQGYQSNISSFLFSFFMVSIPIFFVAWYLGSTVSDVSFNIRRREIGLLSTKGLSSGQIQRMFLVEALVIGVIAGVLGVVGGLIINQYYAGAVNLNTLFTSKLYSPDVMIVTVFFGVLLSLLSVYWSSRKASRIPAVEALRNDPTITRQPHRRIIPIIALALGSYSIIVALLGVNVPNAYQQWLYTSGNIFLSELYPVVSYFDMFMGYFGFFFFLWGLTTIIIRDSTKFQTVVTKISSVMGDLGALAAKNVRRNPARLTAIAFVIALILCLSVQVTGQIASQKDYIQRTVQGQVGADITVNLANATEGQIVLRELLLNVSGIQNATVERILNPVIAGNTVTMKTIDPTSWTLSAYYEDGWFSGNNVDEIMRLMKADNNTVVISRTLAKQLNKQLFDTIAADFRSSPRTLKIVGFFGPEPNDNQGAVPLPYYATRDSISSNIPIPPIYYNGGYNSPYDCYAPRDLFNATGADSEIYQLEYFTTNILIKLKPEANGTQVANQIRNLDLDIASVSSYDEQWRRSNQMENAATFSSMQTLDIQSFGLMFVVISASVGTCLIALVSLKERTREATLMSVRGLSYRQLVWVFLVESLAIITFAVILGALIGVVLVYGAVASTNSVTATWSFSLVTQRLIFPPDAIATIATYAGLIYAATIGAIIVMSSQYVTKLEKMVRTR
jgi:ABC-type lipoprotein release transport system permease subunit